MNKIYHKVGLSFKPLMKLLQQEGRLAGLQRQTFFTRRKLSAVLIDINKQKGRRPC